MFDFAALEGLDLFALEGKPVVLVAVHCGSVASFGHLVIATVQEAIVFVLTVDSADGSILLFKGDREELAFGGCDQGFDVGIHLFVLVYG